MGDALADHVGLPPPEDALQAAASRVQDAFRGAGDEGGDGGEEHDGGGPAGWLARAAGLDEGLRLPDGQRLVGGELVLVLAAACVDPMADPGLAEDDQAALLALGPRDWAAVIVGLAREGPGAPTAPERLVELIENGDGLAPRPLQAGEAAVLARGLEVLAPAWRLLGITDGQARLTELGVWLLPRAACLVWGADFDAQPA